MTDLDRLSKATAHPLRMRIMSALSTGTVSSPSLLAEELEQPLGNVSYHVRELVGAELVELVRTEPVRGALQHFYKLTPAGTAVLKAAEKFEKSVA